MVGHRDVEDGSGFAGHLEREGVIARIPLAEAELGTGVGRLAEPEQLLVGPVREIVGFSQ